MQWLSALWWVGYSIVGIILQRYVPGIDTLAPGLLLSLQERKPYQSLWLTVLFIAIQEGTGSLDFGLGLLWYGGLVVLLRIGSQFFSAESMLTVLLVSVGMGALRIGSLWLMQALSGMTIDYIALIDESIVQSIIFFVLWLGARLLRPKRFSYAERD